MPVSSDIPSPGGLLKRHTRMAALLEHEERSLEETGAELEKTRSYIALSEKVTQALETLNRQLFKEILTVIEKKLTIALQEVLEQPVELKTEVEWKRNSASVDFWIERDGNREDIIKGQGGSVANILSAGLRIFALTTLGPSHRKFLVLDEQDCWLHPQLVPRFVKIIREAGTALGFQVLMVSHHDAEMFRQYADRIYRLQPKGEEGVTLEREDVTSE